MLSRKHSVSTVLLVNGAVVQVQLSHLETVAQATSVQRYHWSKLLKLWILSKMLDNLLDMALVILVTTVRKAPLTLQSAQSVLIIPMKNQLIAMHAYHVMQDILENQQASLKTLVLENVIQDSSAFQAQPATVQSLVDAQLVITAQQAPLKPLLVLLVHTNQIWDKITVWIVHKVTSVLRMHRHLMESQHRKNVKKVTNAKQKQPLKMVVYVNLVSISQKKAVISVLIAQLAMLVKLLESLL